MEMFHSRIKAKISLFFLTHSLSVLVTTARASGCYASLYVMFQARPKSRAHWAGTCENPRPHISPRARTDFVSESVFTRALSISREY